MFKRMILLKLFIFLAVCLFTVKLHAREDPYDKLAREFSESASILTPPKIAILPFAYIDKRKSDGGLIVSERLTTRIVKLKKLQVIERQLLENVMQELHLESSGLVDADTTKKLGKILGVTAIINGTLLEIENGMVEVNARVIKTETAEVIATSAVEIKKIWSDVPTTQMVSPQAVPQGQAQVPEQPAYAPAPSYQPKRGYGSYGARPVINGFVDFITGSGGGRMNLTFNNNYYQVSEVDLSLDFNGSGWLEYGVYYKKIAFPDAKTDSASLPLGIRIGAFGKTVGGDIEFSYMAQRLSRQKTTFKINDGTPRGFEFWVDDYFTIKTFTMAFDLLIQFADKNIRPYIGGGIGLTFNSISSPYIYGYSGSGWKKPMDDFGVGFTLRAPMGLRIMIGDSSSLFLEYRITTNMFDFDRGIKSENDSVSITTNQFLFGLSASFK